MATVLITGGTGLIGKAMSKLLLEKGYEVIILTRDAEKQQSKKDSSISYASWDIKKQTIDTSAVQKADYIIHLTGAGVADKRWTEKRKKEILDSRTKSSALIIKSLRENDNKVKAVVSASGIGWYGPDPAPAGSFKENDPAHEDFLGQTCLQWEQSIQPVTAMGKRLVILRTGIVLSKENGALAEFRKPIRFGVAAVLGDGTQVISWIHIDDLCRIYLNAIENENLIGVYNAVAPQPLSNKDFTVQLAKAMNGNLFIPVPVPSFVLKIVLGEMSVEVLKSATVSAEKILQAGFVFKYPGVEKALESLV